MKKLFSLVTIMSLLMEISGLAFSFPVPDWGALLNDKKAMVNGRELALYTEGKLTTAPYYGAKFEPRGGTYIGMVAEESEQFHPLGSYLTYIEDMWQPDLYYPANQMIREDNVITTVGWTISNMNNIDYNNIRSVLERLNSYGKPMLIRFANEMNVSILGDNPTLYVDSFRTVANMIHEYENLAVVWAPNDLGALDRPFEYFYPGDEYVDWIGISCYPIKYFLGNLNTSYNDSVYFMTGDYAWATNRIKPIVEFMEKNNINKPLMLSECGIPTSDKFGEDLQSWATPRFRDMFYNLIMKYPQIKMINYFNKDMYAEAHRYGVNSYQYATDIINEARLSGAYITGYNQSPQFVFASADKSEHLIAVDGIVRLYTYARIDNRADVTVNYSIDGQWYHSSNSIPYTCYLNVSALADGKHSMSIWVDNIKKDYTFYKYGNIIRFGAEVEYTESVTSSENTSIYTEQNPVSVTLNGSKIEFDQNPVIENGRTLVPLRAIFEALGAQVSWDQEKQTVVAAKNGTYVSLTIGEDFMTVGNVHKSLDVPAQIVNDRTLVPVRAISEAFACSVDWDDTTKTVILTQ